MDTADFALHAQSYAQLSETSGCHTLLICQRPRSIEPPLLWFVALQSPPDSAIAMATAHAYGGLVPPLLSHRDSQET
jgi:hypothetical protein